MICCDNCDSRFHDECIGLTESEASDYGVKNLPYFCAECERLKSVPLNSLTYCVCKSEESGEMIIIIINSTADTANEFQNFTK